MRESLSETFDLKSLFRKTERDEDPIFVTLIDGKLYPATGDEKKLFLVQTQYNTHIKSPFTDKKDPMHLADIEQDIESLKSKVLSDIITWQDKKIDVS